MAAIATFCGYARLPRPSRTTLLGHLHCVESHYARLFEEAPSLAGPGGNLVFTGTDDDPGTLETLRDAGLPRSLGGGRHRARLASRPLPRHGIGARPRAADRADAGAARRRSATTAAPDAGAAQLRPLPRQPAGGRPALLAVQGQSGAARAGRDDHGQRAAAWPRISRAAPCCSTPCCRPISTGRCRRCRDDGASSPPCWPASRTSRTSSMRRRRWTNDRRFQVGVQQLKRDRAAGRGRRRLLRHRRRPRSRRCATGSSSASPSRMAASAASAWRCSRWASSAAARCRRPPTST